MTMKNLKILNHNHNFREKQTKSMKIRFLKNKLSNIHMPILFDQLTKWYGDLYRKTYDSRCRCRFFYNLYGNFITVFLIENWLIKNLFRVTYNFLPSSQIFMDSFFFQFAYQSAKLYTGNVTKRSVPLFTPKTKMCAHDICRSAIFARSNILRNISPAKKCALKSSQGETRGLSRRNRTSTHLLALTCGEGPRLQVARSNPPSVRRHWSKLTCKKESDNNTGNTAHSRGLCQWMWGRQTLSG